MFGQRASYTHPLELGIPDGFKIWQGLDYHIWPDPDLLLELNRHTKKNCFCNPENLQGQQGYPWSVYWHNDITRAEAEKNKDRDTAVEILKEYFNTLTSSSKDHEAILKLIKFAKPITLPVEVDTVVILKGDRKQLSFDYLKVLFNLNIIVLVNFATDLGLILQVKDPYVIEFIEEFN